LGLPIDTDSVDVRPLLSDIVKKAKFRGVIEALEKDVRVKVPFTEYVSLCSAHNIEENEAVQLAQALHASGKFLVSSQVALLLLRFINTTVALYTLARAPQFSAH
jgi:hypothetical protein